MNLTGKWIGQYTYGNGYPKLIFGNSEPFELDILDIDGKIRGHCIDSVTKFVEGNESTIKGIFQDSILSFHKTYKHQVVIDENGNRSIDPNPSSDGIHYVGNVKRSLLFNKVRFYGEWQINGFYDDEEGVEQRYSIEGTWTMKKK